MAVKEEYRKQGIATKLMNKAEEIAKKENITMIWLFSGFHRKDAHELYRKLGYNEYKDKAFVKQILKKQNEKDMWLYWCLLSTIISGFTSIAMKKCSNNE